MRYLKEKEKQGEDLMRKIGERLEISSRFRKILRALAVAAVILTITAGCADYIGAWGTGSPENNAGSIAKNTEDNAHNIPEFYNPQLYAWWGTIYPEFCFEKGEDTDETKPVKLSFWLAKALDW